MCNYCLKECHCKCDSDGIYFDLDTEKWYCPKCKCEVE